MAQKTMCVDFDGTIADYSQGFQGRGVFGAPLPGVQVVFNQLRQDGWKIIIFTTRSEVSKLKDYFDQHGIIFDEINSNSDQPADSNHGKPIADVYIDDRGITFNGNWVDMYPLIRDFKPWFEK